MPETCWDWAAPRWPGSNRQRAAFRSKNAWAALRRNPPANGTRPNECSGVNTRGYIALQSEGGPLEFRNIYLTEVE